MFGMINFSSNLFSLLDVVENERNFYSCLVQTLHHKLCNLHFHALCHSHGHNVVHFWPLRDVSGLMSSTDHKKQKSDSTALEGPGAKEARKERKVLEKKMALNRKRKLDSRCEKQILITSKCFFSTYIEMHKIYFTISGKREMFQARRKETWETF